MVLSEGSLAFAQSNMFPGSGNVGIGTTSPIFPLHLSGTGAEERLAIQTTSSTGSPFIFFKNGTTSSYAGIQGTSNHLLSSGGGIAHALVLSTTGVNPIQFGINNVAKVTLDTAGNVGIGTTSPGALLDILCTGAACRTTPPLNVHFGDGTQSLHVANSGNVGIGTASPSSKLHVAGNARITGDLTTDGNIAAKYQDVAEWVPAKTSLPDGTVVVIDPLQGNGVLPASQAYDTRVAGVVSPQPGILLGEEGENKVKVAHSGRVKVRADARYGAIGVGDLLVTSATSGDAMRSNPVDVNGVPMHRPGTIIGKALEPLTEGEGEILVLLTLQ